MKLDVTKKSTYELQERLDMLFDLRSKTHDYRHILEDEDELNDMIADQINDICVELDKRIAEGEE